MWIRRGWCQPYPLRHTGNSPGLLWILSAIQLYEPLLLHDYVIHNYSRPLVSGLILNCRCNRHHMPPGRPLLSDFTRYSANCTPGLSVHRRVGTKHQMLLDLPPEIRGLRADEALACPPRSLRCAVLISRLTACFCRYAVTFAIVHVTDWLKCM